MTGAAGGDQLHRLREAIEGLDLAVHGDVIAEARALADRLEAVICAAEAAYTSAGLAPVEGFANTASFERHRCAMTLTRARRVARRAARVATWPALGDAWRSGRLTGDQVELVASVIPERHLDRFAETLTATIAILAPLSAFQTGKVLRHWVGAADDAAQREAVENGTDPVTAVPERELSASRVGDELALRGFVDTDSAVVVEHALHAAERDDLPGESRTPKQRRADALVEICQHYLDTMTNPGSNRRRERLVITADIVTIYRAWLRACHVVTAADLDAFFAARPGLGELDRGLFLDAFTGHTTTAATLDGNPVTDSLVAAVASGGVMELMLTTQGRILELGYTTRTFTPAQRRAVLTRDQGCRSCGADPSTCDIHHVVAWDEGGTTDIANAVALCGRCHRMLHRRRWANRIEPDGTYTITLDDGTTRTTRPPGLTEQPQLPVATTAQPATPPDLPPPPTRRPRCNCPCLEHRSDLERAHDQRGRRLALANLTRITAGSSPPT